MFKALVLLFYLERRRRRHKGKAGNGYGNNMTDEQCAGVAFKRQLHVAGIVGVAFAAV